MDRVERDALRAWTPVRINIAQGEPTIDWAIVQRPFLEPFFEQSAYAAMDHPFNAAFGRRTSLAILDELAAGAPVAPPAGLIFHMSRCGSTLVAQMLSRLTRAVVLSEPQPVDALLRLRPRLGDVLTAARLRALVEALAGRRAADGRVFVKLHAWHVLALPLFAAAFPHTPWAFVFREPRAVLRSQTRSPGAEVIAGTVDPALLGIDARAAYTMPPDEYAARAIRAICDGALREAGRGRAAFVAYDTLPESAIAGLLDFFGIAVTREEAAEMRQTALLDAKSLRVPFHRPGESTADVETERRAAALLDAPYAAMRALALR